MSKDIDNEPVSYRYTFLLLNLIGTCQRQWDTLRD